MIPTGSVVVRPYDKACDEDFLYSTWLRCYKHYSYFAKRIKPQVFFPNHQKIVDHILRKTNTTVLVAHPKNDMHMILGYVVFERTDDKTIVHFTHVKDAFKKMGIAKALFKSGGIDPEKLTFTHWTLDVNDLMRKYENMIYDPYAL